MLDKIKWVLDHTEAPISVNANPKTVEDAVDNLRAFSDEGRASPQTFEDAAQITTFPPITRCYGWLRIDSNKLPRRFHKYRQLQRPRGYREVGVHYAMVYEYVPNTGEHDADVIQAHFDFFYLAGFAVHELKHDNWLQGKLVDFCDLASLVDPFALSRWRRRDARVCFGLPAKAESRRSAKDDEPGEAGRGEEAGSGDGADKASTIVESERRPNLLSNLNPSAIVLSSVERREPQSGSN
jgi:hypothetical protein